MRKINLPQINLFLRNKRLQTVMRKKLSNDEQRAADIAEHEDEVFYSARYSDDVSEYRHVIVPKNIAKWLPTGELMEDHVWRSFGIRQSAGWVHYMIHSTTRLKQVPSHTFCSSNANATTRKSTATRPSSIPEAWPRSCRSLYL